MNATVEDAYLIANLGCGIESQSFHPRATGLPIVDMMFGRQDRSMYLGKSRQLMLCFMPMVVFASSGWHDTSHAGGGGGADAFVVPISRTLPSEIAHGTGPGWTTTRILHDDGMLPRLPFRSTGLSREVDPDLVTNPSLRRPDGKNRKESKKCRSVGRTENEDLYRLCKICTRRYVIAFGVGCTGVRAS